MAPSLPPELLYTLATRALRGGEMSMAASLFRDYAEARPDELIGHFQLGYTRFFAGEPDAAADAFAAALRIRPDDVQSLCLRGMALATAGRAEEAEEMHRRALAAEPRSALERASVALVRLAYGDFPRGWADLEARWEVPHAPALPFRPGEHPRWDGRPAPDATLCVHAEGGAGDLIMFARFLSGAAGRVGRLVVVALPGLVRLMEGVPGVTAVVERGEPLPEGALHTSVWSLPALLGTTLDTLPAAVPYLGPPPAGPGLGEGREPRVGIAWAGNPTTPHDRYRSVPDLALLAPLLEEEGVEWVSLQAGTRAAEGARFGIRPMPPVSDFADTAYLISQLDLVVTVDTSVAHLAAALGAATWILPPSVPEFRWMLDRDDSPWYPTARLFRRSGADSWPELAERLRSALRVWLADRSR